MKYTRPTTNVLLAGLTTFVLGVFLAIAKLIVKGGKKRGKTDDEVGRG